MLSFSLPLHASFRQEIENRGLKERTTPFDDDPRPNAKG